MQAQQKTRTADYSFPSLPPRRARNLTQRLMAANGVWFDYITFLREREGGPAQSIRNLCDARMALFLAELFTDRALRCRALQDYATGFAKANSANKAWAKFMADVTARAERPTPMSESILIVSLSEFLEIMFVDPKLRSRLIDDFERKLSDEHGPVQGQFLNV